MAVLSLCMLIPTSAMAIRFYVEAGDRPYYTYGPRYWHQGYQWLWVPGHWSRHHHAVAGSIANITATATTATRTGPE